MKSTVEAASEAAAASSIPDDDNLIKFCTEGNVVSTTTLKAQIELTVSQSKLEDERGGCRLEDNVNWRGNDDSNIGGANDFDSARDDDDGWEDDWLVMAATWKGRRWRELESEQPLLTTATMIQRRQDADDDDDDGDSAAARESDGGDA
ncbi:unnamed protein product [Linum tenue]|uniref:Uncharacterized protein n=1 Tax=Linum tenue TaxID=586396 RepID=A0AAV0P7N3_9ROSI|nr:unnamed protein product [Linum tenue]